MDCGCSPRKLDTSCPKEDACTTRAVLETKTPEEMILFRKVVVPASIGTDTDNPPQNGAYKNVLLYYEANGASYLYSSDGIPTKLVNGITNYEDAINLPQINGVTLLGNKSAADLGLADAPMVINVTNGNTIWSGADTAEDVYDFFLNKGKVNIIFNGEENYPYGIASAAYIPGEEKMMCTLAVATMTGGGTAEFDGNALFGTMTLYTADKAIDVSQIELQPKLYVADFTGLELNYNELSGLPATTYSIGMVKSGDGLEVANDGTLSISNIEQYAHFFDTVADMKNATNLVAGSYAKTIGHVTKTDNGGCLYFIRNKLPTDKPNNSTIIELDDNSLVAELVYTNEYIPVDYQYVRYQGGASRRTDVWYAIIPADFKPDLYIANDTLNTVEEPSHASMNNMLSVMINGGVGTGNEYATPIGVIIKDGVTLKDNSGNTDDHAVLMMKQDGTLKSMPGSSTTTAIEAEEPQWAVCGWWPIIENGVDYSGDHDPTDYKPRTFIGQDADGNYFVAVCAGRQYSNPGLSAVDMKNFVESTGFVATFLYSLDGGGSSVLVNRGKRVNSLDNYENRSLPNYIGFKSSYAKNKGVFESAYSANIVDVNSKILTKSSDVRGYIIQPDTTSASVSLDTSSKYIIYGDLVSLNLEFTTSAELARYAIILENLPPATKNYLTFLAFTDDNNDKAQPLYIQDGKLRVNASNPLPAGHYHANIVYQLKYNS